MWIEEPEKTFEDNTGQMRMEWLNKWSKEALKKNGLHLNLRLFVYLNRNSVHKLFYL
jgi:hypothetical protein